MKRRKIIYYILKISLAFSLTYAALSSFRDPYSWIGYIPDFAKGFIPDIQLLQAFGVLQIILSLWILGARKVFIPATISAVIISGIVIFNLKQMDILFRDIPIILIAVSLALWDFKK